jgi:hypothetical protein
VGRASQPGPKKTAWEGRPTEEDGLGRPSYQKDARPLPVGPAGVNDNHGTDIMNKLLTFRRLTSLALLAVLVLVLWSSQPVQGATLAGALGDIPQFTASPVSGLLLADDDGWSLKHLFKNANSRTRVIQVCVGIMCLALVILMKK